MGEGRLCSRLKGHGECPCMRVESSVYCRRDSCVLEMKQKGINSAAEEKVSLHSPTSSVFLCGAAQFLTSQALQRAVQLPAGRQTLGAEL